MFDNNQVQRVHHCCSISSISHICSFHFRPTKNRGFRQATRGADTGAFHHPHFRRDQPELCLQMVCQKSRDRQASIASTSNSGNNIGSSSNNKRSLPPKKRVFAATESCSVSASSPPSASPSARSSPINEQTSVISADDRSTGNCSPPSKPTLMPTSVLPSVGQIFQMNDVQDQLPTSSTTTALLTPKTSVVAATPPPPTPRPAGGKTAAAAPLPFISNDEKFVSSILQKRDAMEIIRAAKSQLFEAYQKAMTNEK
jgi:hypothetical protein